MLLRLLYDDLLAQAAYLIGCQRTREAIVIDPARDVDRYVEAARAAGLRLLAATETHIHADFLSGTRELVEKHGAHGYVSAEGGPDWQYGWTAGRSVTLLRDGDTIRIGQIELRVVHTPGHTPEHVCFIVTDRGGGADQPMGIASGDFVFVGDLGRPDLLETAAGVVAAKEPAARDLARSARRFLELPDWLQVWPGHGAGSACGKALGAVPQSTVGYERRFNAPLGLAGDEDAFVRGILEGQPDPPLYFGRMKRENRDGPPPLGALARPDRGALPDDDGVVIVDTRPLAAATADWIPGSLLAPWGAMFLAAAGSYVRPGEAMHLIVEDARVDTAVRGLARIGLDDVAGWSRPAEAESSGRSRQLPDADPEAMDAPADGAVVLDVRSADEHAERSVEGSLHVPHTRLLERLDDLPKERPLLVHCQTGSRSAVAAAMLRRHGFDAINVRGGIAAWHVARKSGVTAPGR